MIAIQSRENVNISGSGVPLENHSRGLLTRKTEFIANISCKIMRLRPLPSLTSISGLVLVYYFW